jgi:hypothetical protein
MENLNIFNCKENKDGTIIKVLFGSDIFIREHKYYECMSAIKKWEIIKKKA